MYVSGLCLIDRYVGSAQNNLIWRHVRLALVVVLLAAGGGGGHYSHEYPINFLIDPLSQLEDGKRNENTLHPALFYPEMRVWNLKSCFDFWLLFIYGLMLVIIYTYVQSVYRVLNRLDNRGALFALKAIHGATFIVLAMSI